MLNCRVETLSYLSFPPLLRYHNGTLLDKKVYKYEEDLVLRDLKPEQSGEYYCKTSSPAGTIKSSPSFLTVIGMHSLRLLVASII